MPTISIILTTYNRDFFIHEAIESILQQDYKDFELLVIDDGSTDGTYEKVYPYLNYFTYIRHKSNLGVSAARNTGIKHSSGELICFLDSDDLWKKKKLFSQIMFLKANPAYQICYTGEIWLHNGSWLNQKLKHKKFSGYIFEKLLPLCLISPSSVMISRQLLNKTGGFDESMVACEDYDLWLRIGSRYPVGYLEDRLIIKRGGHKDQLSQQFVGLDKLRIKALLKIIDGQNLSDEQIMAAQKELKKKCEIYGLGCMKNKKEEEGQFFQSVSLNLDGQIKIDYIQDILKSSFFSQYTFKEALK